MTTIYLLRHTEYDNPYTIVAGRLPLALSDKGERDAHKLKEFFSDKNITQIYSSYVHRCRQTSEIIADDLIPLDFDLRLLETFSALQGAKASNGFSADGYDYFAHRHVLGGENYEQIQNRMIDFFESTNWEDGSNYIICSHGDPLYMLYQYLKGAQRVPDFEHGVEHPGFPNYQEKGSILQIDIDEQIVLNPVIRVEDI